MSDHPRKLGKFQRVHSQETIDTARRYWDAGMTATEIGRKMGVSKSTIIGVAYRNNFSLRAKRGVAWRRPVTTPEGRFTSARSAARAYGLSCAGAQKRAERHTLGWRYADE